MQCGVFFSIVCFFTSKVVEGIYFCQVQNMLQLGYAGAWLRHPAMTNNHLFTEKD